MVLVSDGSAISSTVNFGVITSYSIHYTKLYELAVRANARINEETIEDPLAYQDFFAVLDKAMFLTLHDVD